MYVTNGKGEKTHIHTYIHSQKEEKTGQQELIELEALAVAKRRRDLPRLSEQHEGMSSADEEEAADDEMKVGTFHHLVSTCKTKKKKKKRCVQGRDLRIRMSIEVDMFLICFFFHTIHT